MRNVHLRLMVAAILWVPLVGVAQDMASGGAGAGNITGQLNNGMFLNPTAPGQDLGDLTAQYCISATPVPGAMAADGSSMGKDYAVGHGGLAVYGITEWLEVGGQFLIAGRDPDNTAESAGPQVRVQLLQGDDAFADVSVGGVFLFNDVERQVAFGAVSKNVACPLGEKCPCQAIVVHLGARQFWQNVKGGANVDDAVAYGGIEFLLGDTISLIGEIQSKADADSHQPFSVGFQAHHKEGFACSLAAIQPGTTDGIGVFAGIGIPFN